MKALRSTYAVFALLALFGTSAIAQEAAYEGGRGLITLEGPAGMFINPTSGTLPAGSATAQYCIFFPNNTTDEPLTGHGGLAEYAISDELNVGGQISYLDFDARDEEFLAGPNARYRLTQDDGSMPQTAVGAYSRFGEDAFSFYGAYGAAYKRIALENDSVKAIGLHGGVRGKWVDEGDDEYAVYAGAELQLPARIYLVGEISSEHDNADSLPYSFGVQWRAGGINMSFAGIDNGAGVIDEPSFYWGIGGAF